MATQTGTVLKTYFNTGDQPTEAQFGDLIDSNLNLTEGGAVVGDTSFSGTTTITTASIGHLTLDQDIQSAAALDATHYIINGKRGEIRSQLGTSCAVDTGFTMELRNTSIVANSLVIATIIGGEGAIVTGSVLTANTVGTSTASLNFFNTGGAIVDNAIFTASFAVL
tara:strand:- start:475 stop:975 length:501 start_codon:yes stop_codon:yes gene_type:complete